MNGDEVIAYYESGVELGRLETPVGRLELARTTFLLERVLEPGCSVLDVGGGTGVYAAWLAGRGHEVTLVEPVGLHLEEARARAGSPPRFAVEEADARSPPLAGGSVDAVLLLGPRLRDQVLAAARWSERELAAASPHLLAVTRA